MLRAGDGHKFLQDNDGRLWPGSSALLPIAERLGLVRSDRDRPGSSGGDPLPPGSPDRESMILLRGTHELAVANGLAEVDRSTRTILTFYEQFADPAAGLALAREGLEIASSAGFGQLSAS